MGEAHRKLITSLLLKLQQQPKQPKRKQQTRSGEQQVKRLTEGERERLEGEPSFGRHALDRNGSPVWEADFFGFGVLLLVRVNCIFGFLQGREKWIELSISVRSSMKLSIISHCHPIFGGLNILLRRILEVLSMFSFICEGC